jgi:hypothetical protein
MEDFFREIGKYQGDQKIHEALSMEEFSKLFSYHGMGMVGPPLVGEWKVHDDGGITQSALNFVK